ncbi:PTS system, lactose/cellobiose family IIC subunit [Coriobacterium glomerans PW2]|uniref:Permease IIC component n=1 Tax=Coriobacterium glomerans (strain ATCC 49209 / DSM 20642 / JCM 10262 / PW2) TaxID=700015 RepID=F2N8X8_CORGP|nr:PTS transporter subunit EIIC [Coriobacterium glomerans]AEB07578.1 PTS system, lactose/cellobiose family IIC subunit [Coriobacterium glomerans PW2]
MADATGYLDRFADVSARIGNQVHLRSLRDGFATIMPLFILAGVAALFNNVVFTWIWGPSGLMPSADVLGWAQYWGGALSNGTLNISAILLCGMIGYCLAQNKRFDNPIACVVIAVSALAVLMPQTVAAAVAPASQLFEEGKSITTPVSGAFTTGYTGTAGLFSAIIVGLLATTVFIKISGVDRLRIKMPEGVPPAVGKSFDVLIPMILSLGAFGLVAMILFAIPAHTDLTAIINEFIQTPLRALTTNVWGLVIIYSIGTFLFTLGIHQTTINGVLVEPILTIVLLNNTALYNAGKAIPMANFMNMDIINVFALMGGSGCTLALLIATFIMGRYRPSKEVAKMAVLPGLFNINEPVIYGYPIVFNIPLMIPFVLNTALGIVISYFATVIGLISPCVIQVPWTCPIVFSGALATGGDLRASVLQVLLLALYTVIYLPFMKASEKSLQKQAELAEQAEQG